MAGAARVVIGLLVAAGILSPLTMADLRSADAMARASAGERARFHADYIFTPKEATVERIEIVTEFRRAVLAGEERLRLGDHMFSLKVLEAALKEWDGRLAIRAEVRFHPLNTYLTVPEYEIVLGTGGADLIEPLDISRAPIAAQTVAPGKPTPLAGAHVEATFLTGGLDRVAWPVRVVLDNRDVAAVSVDFGKLR